MLHTIGFYHEQNRSDRGKYVAILRENIPADKYSNFEKLSSPEEENFGVNYDYGSVLHYSAYAFSLNDKPTIKALNGKDELMGQRNGLSDSDVKKINAMYCNQNL